jgi:hypothetical protein
MAKSLRSNRIQKNKSKLRSRVFGPVEEARTQRLSQRLAEIAASTEKPEPSKRKATSKDSEMDVEAEGEHGGDGAPSKDDADTEQGTSPGAAGAVRSGSGVELRWSRDGFAAVAGAHVDEDDGGGGALRRCAGGIAVRAAV